LRLFSLIHGCIILVNGQKGEMKLTIYADILFLVNLSLNWFSLLLTSKIMKLKSKAWRMLLAASCGALAGTACVFFTKPVATMISEVAATFLMCALSFRAFGFWGYIKICTCLFASGVTLGGSLTLIYSFFNRTGIMLPTQSDLSSAVFILLSLAVTLTALVFERFLNSSKNTRHGEIIIEYGKKRLSMPFFCDSGNFLCEPISGRPAIIVEKEMLHGLLDEDFLNFDPTVPVFNKNDDIYKKLRLIPAKTVCASGVMTGFVPDKITLVWENGAKEVDAVIAIENTLHRNKLRKSAIVGLSLL